MMTTNPTKEVFELLEYKINLKLSYANEPLHKCLPKFTSKHKSSSSSASSYSGIRSIELDLRDIQANSVLNCTVGFNKEADNSILLLI